MTTNRIGPSSAAIDGCVTSAGPAMTPARPASAAPAPNTSMKILGTSWPSIATMSGWVSAAWMIEPDARAGQHDEQRREHRHRRQQHEHAIGGIGGVEQAEGDEIERRRHAIVDRQLAPDHLHELFDDEGEPEGEQQLGDMAEPVQPPQAEALDQRADRADGDRRRQNEARARSRCGGSISKPK